MKSKIEVRDAVATVIELLEHYGDKPEMVPEIVEEIEFALAAFEEDQQAGQE